MADAIDIGLLYSRHHGWLQSWLLGKLGNHGDAADLAHDTYLRLMRSGRLPAREDQSRAFLVQVAKGLVIDLRRRRAIEQSYQEAVSALPPALAPSPESRALILEALTEVDAMLDRLPVKVREAFLLSQLEGLGYREIAQRLSVTVSSVQKYMMTAIQACYQTVYG
ncbi:sigma-70 family RNA polymerase sigma factor [Bordetella hinzii]|uniref:RNA polymerase subunit sigma n=1 Tax=Bordetella hinzii TaxID=103855 RepID=A0AAN1RZL2_9BORD|nr:sigma-70 family RNA polymerase sigma factor [Bordetella hinzii]AKQ55348.1 putative RNA polymerase sigma factor FecI [Bordetella hinzii]AKQ59849.1 putative RNA polymerase sigma factor FecI [Bordetella hinzii]AZW19037.1 RNA polymerase subunit sigma [Bordetella hinzii]KCB30653.1 ECF sigma factor [Bordetella hinzii L60]KCB43633.1 ECF sigma factor [Bordetella hinzii 4161]